MQISDFEAITEAFGSDAEGIDKALYCGKEKDKWNS